MVISQVVLKQLAVLASQKEWPGGKLAPDQIYDILIKSKEKSSHESPKISKKKQVIKKKSLKYDKIDIALLEIKRLKDPRYINVITARKIEKTEKKLNKFFFDDRLKLCCPKENENKWEEAVEYYSSLVEDDESSEFSDEFGWASDETESEGGNWDYITENISTTRNIVKQFFI